jgi:predicted phosphoadenosine phosphosulfate sulfurtransferase
MTSSSGPDFPNITPSHVQRRPTREEVEQDKKDSSFAAVSQGQASSAFKQATDDSSNSAWAQMFPGGATKEEMNKFISQFLNMMVYEFKKSDQKWHKSQEKLKKVAEGRDPDE